MKNLIVSLMIISLTFIVGCHENSITNPVTNENAKKYDNKSDDTYLHETIRLEGALRDPYPVMNSFYIVKGQIDYDLRVFRTERSSPAQQFYASIYLTTEAEFRYLCTVCSSSPEDSVVGFISNISEELVPLSGSSISFLEKAYTISGRQDGMVLIIRFTVTNYRVELNTMWLALADKRIKTKALNYN
ncbi:MAG: hypothetical protein IPM14_06315 [bacterium]|nr:hypothetical protein [bacterium]